MTACETCGRYSRWLVCRTCLEGQERQAKAAAAKLLVFLAVAFAVAISLGVLLNCSLLPAKAPCRPEDASALGARCEAVARRCAPEPAPCAPLDACLAEADARERECLR